MTVSEPATHREGGNMLNYYSEPKNSTAASV